MNAQPPHLSPGRERRQAVRMPYRTSLDYAKCQVRGKGTVRDVSLDGLFFEAPRVFTVGDQIDMHFRFRHTTVDVAIAGEVRHVSPQGVGVRLTW